MTTRDEVIQHLLNDPIYDEILMKYLKNKSERNEFRQELWLILLEMPTKKLIHYYDTKCLTYIYVGIINNQLKSNTSPWHKKYRLNQPMEYVDNYETIDDYEEVLNTKHYQEDKVKYIEDKLNDLLLLNPKLIKEITIFKMHFYDELSYRKIAAKTNITITSIWKYVNHIIYLLKKDKEQIKITDPIKC